MLPTKLHTRARIDASAALREEDFFCWGYLVKNLFHCPPSCIGVLWYMCPQHRARRKIKNWGKTNYSIQDRRRPTPYMQSWMKGKKKKKKKTWARGGRPSRHRRMLGGWRDKSLVIVALALIKWLGCHVCVCVCVCVCVFVCVCACVCVCITHLFNTHKQTSHLYSTHTHRHHTPIQGRHHTQTDHTHQYTIDNTHTHTHTPIQDQSRPVVCIEQCLDERRR